MDPLTTLSAIPKGWLLYSVLAPHADAFVARLKRDRYSPTTARKYLASLAHLARWMTLSMAIFVDGDSGSGGQVS